jgi:DNA-binding NtrC family response regulator
MQRRILIIDDHDDLSTALEEVFTAVGHSVVLSGSRADGVVATDAEEFDVTITDLDVQSDRQTNLNGSTPPADQQHIKAFKVSAAHFRRDEFDEAELKDIVATVLDYKIRHIDKRASVQHLLEHIEFEVPSSLSLMHIVLEYLMRRRRKARRG